MSKLISRESIDGMDTVSSQYKLLGMLFKLLQVSTHHSDGSFFKMCLNFPYYLLFNRKLQTELNLFMAKPSEDTLTATWNFANVGLL